MSRITEVANATLKEELVAPRTIIDWQPNTDAGTIQWLVTKEKWVNGEYLGYGPPDDLLTIDLDEALEYVFDVHLPDGSVVQMPAAMIFLGMKAAFDTLAPIIIAKRTAPPEVMP